MLSKKILVLPCATQIGVEQFYTIEGNPKHNEDITHLYPDLSKFKIYNK